MKYDDLVSTLYSVLYPKMVDIQLKNTSMKQENSSMLKCPQGHKLIDADRTKRKRKNGSVYTSSGFNCDICHRSFSSGQSWHCSCTDSGFDKCVACLVFQLYNIDDNILKVACEDKEEQQQRYRRETVRNIVRLPHGLFRLLTGNIDEDEDDDDDDVDLLALRHQSPYLRQQNMIEGRDDEEFEANLRED
jgi:methionyl-tRNA synthetase